MPEHMMHLAAILRWLDGLLLGNKSHDKHVNKITKTFLHLYNYTV